MIYLRWNEGSDPHYKTFFSAGADLKSRIRIVVPAGEVRKIPTGVWIDRVDWDQVPSNQIPELQIRARSGLALNHGITLANSLGTIDADFPDEIQVLLLNFSKQDYVVEVGERIAQLVLNLTYRIPELSVGGQRVGGFGSTGRADEKPFLPGITLQ